MAVILTGSEYIDLTAHGAALDIRTRPITVYAEFSTENDDESDRAIYTGGSGDPPEILLEMFGGDFFGLWQHTDGVVEAEQGSLDDGNLHRVCFVVSDDFNVIALVVDGSTVDTPSLGGEEDTANASNDTYIGVLDPGTAATFFIGEISNVAVWDAELAEAEAQDLTDGTDDPGDYPTGLLGWWPLDFDARDISGNDRHGTPVGDPDFTEEEPGDEADGGSEATLTITAEGGGTKHASGGSQATVGVTADGAGTAARAGGTAATVTVSAIGGGTKTASGGSDTTVTVTAEGGGFVPGDVLINLDFIALAPVFRQRIATAPEFRDRVALAPEFGHGDAGEPEFADREAGDPVFAHGSPTTPETKPRTALAPVFAHGDAGEPTT